MPLAEQLDLMDFYSNYDNFIAEPLISFFPEAYKETKDYHQERYHLWILTMNKILKEHPESWINFLTTVEQGYEILNVQGATFVGNADTRKKMYVASLICFSSGGNDA